MLKIKRRKFFELLAKYREDPDNFSIQYRRRTINRKIDPDIEKNIVKALEIERFYRRVQDRLVRVCTGEGISDINQAQSISNDLIQKYNYQWAHSTTGEIPYIRFQRALRERRSLFREFTIKPPYKSTKDVISLRVDRMVNSYRKVSINKLELRVPEAPCPD